MFFQFAVVVPTLSLSDTHAAAGHALRHVSVRQQKQTDPDGTRTPLAHDSCWGHSESPALANLPIATNVDPSGNAAGRMIEILSQDGSPASGGARGCTLQGATWDWPGCLIGQGVPVLASGSRRTLRMTFAHDVLTGMVQKQTLIYDALLRPLTVNKPDMSARWTLGSGATAHEIGKHSDVASEVCDNLGCRADRVESGSAAGAADPTDRSPVGAVRSGISPAEDSGRSPDVDDMTGPPSDHGGHSPGGHHRLPGSPQEDQRLAKAAEAVRGHRPQGTLRLASNSSVNEEKCGQQYAEDTATCKRVTKKRGARAGAACHASAAQRYGACLAGKPLPPLSWWERAPTPAPLPPWLPVIPMPPIWPPIIEPPPVPIIP